MQKNICPICGGQLKKAMVIHQEIDKGGKFYIFEHVAAEVCQKCGEYLFSDKVAKQIETMIIKSKPIRKITVPVFDLAINKRII
ncbi:MAG: YgiT-type zinc finger protein [Patescibacteria group bacterium]